MAVQHRADSRNLDHNAQAIVDQCLEVAHQQRASDVHIEPQGKRLLIRMRIDGRLKVWQELPIEAHPQVVARVKIMASMDISEKRLPQDGRFSVVTPTGVRDYRVATVPMMEGEKAVIRVLQQDLSRLSVKTIGYSERNFKVYHELLAKPHGLLLHCGPTGSGKTTALYAAINHLSKSWRNVQTIEDPVEGNLDGVNQAQVNPEVGRTFAALLRAYLRQDCDVILVGEIRDTETAQLAVQASMTGHLVLGTLHTNSAAGAVSRLVDMGIPPFFIGTGLIGTVSQRLVRRLCKHCKRAFKPPPDIAQQYNIPADAPLYEAVGCDACGKLGYRGRVGIQEVLVVTPKVREAIHRNATESELQTLSLRGGMVNIFRDGVEKAINGSTTLEEIYNTIVAESI